MKYCYEIRNIYRKKFWPRESLFLDIIETSGLKEL